MEYLACARHYANTFAWICSFKLYNNSMSFFFFLIHVLRIKKLNPKEFKNLLKGTQLVSGPATNSIQVFQRSYYQPL